EVFEAVFEVQGVLMSFDLPPITSREQLEPKPQWAKQSVHIMGFGAPEFDQALEAVNLVHRRMSELYRLGSVKDRVVDDDDEAEGTVPLDFSNRYVTPKSRVNKRTAVPFDPLIDPHKILERTMKSIGQHL
ncbi:hypothetical protein BV25DRAFT_1789615, partial [Artomyces pyxidatus]